MMASPTNTIKSIQLKKPLVVIKKGFLFKPNNPLILRTASKRPIAESSDEQSPSKKRPCVTVPHSVRPVVRTYIMPAVQSEKTTQANTENKWTGNSWLPSAIVECVMDEHSIKKSNEQVEIRAIKQKEEFKPDNKGAINNVANKSVPKRDKKYDPNLFMRRVTDEDAKCPGPSRCLKHEVLPEQQAEGLLKAGDTFKSIEEFDEYTNNQAKKWFFYYARSDSRNLKTGSCYDSTRATYIHYFCRFNKYSYKSRSKGIRKRNNSECRLKCPAAVTVKCAAGKDEYTVLNVCHHHSHELSVEIFNKTPHGHRLPKEIKDEIRDLALFDVDPMITRRYIESKMPGLTLKKTVYNRIQMAKKSDLKDAMSPERVEEMLAKIKYIKANFSSAPSQAIRPKAVKVTKRGSNSSPNKAGKVKILFDQTIKNIEISSEESTRDGVNDNNLDYNFNTETKETVIQVESKINKIKSAPKVEYFPTESRCQRRHVKFPEHKAEGLIKVGDTFSSMEEFARYAAAHALQWFFYYQVHNSRNVKTTDRYDSSKKTAYNLTCRFNKGWYKSKSVGLRKVKRKTIRCPAMVNMVCNPGEDRFKVMYVCHHHSHELSHEVFSQEAHGHRLAPELKEEIRELAWFQLDRRLMRQYFQKKTGFDLRPTIKNVLGKMRQEKQKLHITPKKEKEILNKIKDIKQNFKIPKRAPPKKNRTNEEERSDSEDEGSESRLVTRLNNILYDEELIQSVRELQATTGCELRIIPWEDVNTSKGVSLLQAGLIEETNEDQKPNITQLQTTCSDVKHSGDDNNDNQVEIDNELYEVDYTMDEDVHYIVPTEHDGTNTFVLDDTTQQNVFYTVPSNHDGTNTFVLSDSKHQNLFYTVPSGHDGTNAFAIDDTTQQAVHCAIPPDHDGTSTFVVDDTAQQNVHCTLPSDEDGTNTFALDDTTQQSDDKNCTNDTTILEEITKSSNHDAESENSDENDFHVTYQYNAKDSLEIEPTDHTSYARCSIKTESRDIGVQADFELIGLERNYEKIKNQEFEMMKEDLLRSKFTVNTRSRPKAVLEEDIINRYNIEFYLNVAGIIACLEQLAVCMKLPALHLLNKVYQGQAVFKMTLGTNGTQDRKTVQLTYVPLTLAFPYEKQKYINGLQAYKNMCSKYSDVTIKLEKTIESMSTELKDLKQKIKILELQKQEFIRVMKNHETLVKNYDLNEQLLKQTQEHKTEAQNENKVLLKKVKNLEFIHIASLPKEDPLDQQILKNTQEDLAEAHSRIKVLLEKIKKLELLQLSSQPQDGETSLSKNSGLLRQLLLEPPELENSETNTVVDMKSKVLEDNSDSEPSMVSDESDNESNPEIKIYKHRLKDDQELYLSDSRLLLDKIASHEKELDNFKEKKYSEPLSSSSNTFESENIKLRNEIKDLKLQMSSKTKQNHKKIKMLLNSYSTLSTKFKEEKAKNQKIQNYDCTNLIDPLA